VLTIYQRLDDDFVVEQALRCRFVPLVGAPVGPSPAGSADDGGGDEDAGRWEDVVP